MIRAILLDDTDNVVVLTADADPGETIEVVGAKAYPTIAAGGAVPMGHKMAVRPLAKGTLVRKYGEVIGCATANIDAGEHVHIHNVASLRG